MVPDLEPNQSVFVTRHAACSFSRAMHSWQWFLLWSLHCYKGRDRYTLYLLEFRFILRCSFMSLKVNTPYFRLFLLVLRKFVCATLAKRCKATRSHIHRVSSFMVTNSCPRQPASWFTNTCHLRWHLTPLISTISICWEKEAAWLKKSAIRIILTV